MKRFFAILIIIAVFVCGGFLFFEYFSSLGEESVNNSEEKEEIISDDLFGKYYKDADKLLKNMTLEEKIGQLFLVRYDVNYAPRWVKEYNAGGFVLFAKDFDGHTVGTINKELKNLKDLSKSGLALAVDEEGGYVTRVSRYSNFRDSKFKSPRAFYDEGGYDLLEQTEREKAKLLLSLGLNVNLAPVADVSMSDEDYINNRAFGMNATATSEFIKNMVGYANSEGISSCLKHFPGYGNNKDTHTGIAIDERSYEEFVENDFLPFQSGIEEKVPMVLVSHNVVNCMDSEYPASLSKKVISELRNNLKFSGIIVTDDLAMDAVNSYATDGSAAILAINAGNDMIITSSFEEMYDIVLNAVNDKTIDIKTVDTAVRRVLAWKLAYQM